MPALVGTVKTGATRALERVGGVIEAVKTGGSSAQAWLGGVIDDASNTLRKLYLADDTGAITIGGKADEGTNGGVGLVYRGGSRTPSNMTPRPGVDNTGLSVFDNAAAAAPNGGKVQVIDTSRLRCAVACPDAPPAGHISIQPAELQDLTGWAATRGTDEVHALTQDILDAIVDEIRIPRP